MFSNCNVLEFRNAFLLQPPLSFLFLKKPCPKPLDGVKQGKSLWAAKSRCEGLIRCEDCPCRMGDREICVCMVQSSAGCQSPLGNVRWMAAQWRVRTWVEWRGHPGREAKPSRLRASMQKDACCWEETHLRRGGGN